MIKTLHGLKKDNLSKNLECSCGCNDHSHEHKRDNIHDEHSHEHSHKDEEGCCTEHEHHKEHEQGCCCNESSENEYNKSCDFHEFSLNKINKNNITKEYFLKGLSCAGCAAKIEQKVKNLKQVDNAVLAFATSTLMVETDNTALDEISCSINDIVSLIEPSVKVIDKDIECNDENTSKEEDGQTYNKKKIIRIIAGIVLFVLALILKKQNVAPVLFVMSYLFIGMDIIVKSIRNISKGEVFDENFLMMVATVAALAIGEYPEGIMVVLLYQIGEYFQDRAVDSSRKSIAKLMDIRPDYANIKDGNEISKVSPNKVKVGDIIIVKPGEKVPLDGIVIEGESSMDTAALTGESIPRNVKNGDKIISGFISINGVLSIKVTKSFKDSAVSKILDLVQNATSKKAKTEKRITKLARYYTPIVVFLAVATAIIPPLLFQGQSFTSWIYKAAIFLVISCPCAIVISVPMGYFAGIGASSKNGILVKGGNYLEALKKAKVVVFDKTGTLTLGNFKVKEIHGCGDINEDELLKYTAYAESFSNHPIALSILNEYSSKIDKSKVKNFKEITGKGVEAFVFNKHIISGNSDFMKENNINYKEVVSYGTVVHTVVDNEYIGYMVIQDEIKEDSHLAIMNLKKLNIKDIIMLTGDRKEVAHSVAKKIGVDRVYSNLMPHEKVEKVEDEYKNKGSNESLIFVGDGINDAPVLARADVGVAMGGVGSDAAIEAADIVIMNDEPSKLATVIKIAKVTNKIVNHNIIFSLGTKVVVLMLAILGFASMWLAVFADVGVAILAVMNSMRILKIKY